MSSEEIKDESSNHKFRVELPSIIYELGLDPYDIAVYSYYKKVAGDNGKCFQSLDTICKKINIGRTKLQEVKKKLEQKFHLLGCSLLKITKRKEGEKNLPDLVVINDIWPQNYAYILNMQKNNSNPLHGGGVVRVADEGSPPHGSKEEPFKKNPLEEEKKQERKDEPDPQDVTMCDLSFFLFQKIKEEIPTAVLNQPFDMLVREMLNMHTEEHLKEIIEWAFDHDFWSVTITSPKTLLKSLPTIKKQMERDGFDEPEFIPQEKPLSKTEIIFNALNKFIISHWSEFKAAHLMPFVENLGIYFDDYRESKFGKNCFKANCSESDFIDKFNNFMKDRSIRLKFNA